MQLDVSDEYRALLTSAHGYMTACQDALRSDYDLNAWPRYDWDQASASLTFSDLSGPRVRASIQFVGSVSTKSDTWRWSWANDTLRHEAKCRMSSVRAYGEEHEIPQLATDCWSADEVDGWEMTSIAGYLLGAKGSYRTPDGNGFLYMVIMDIHWVS